MDFSLGHLWAAMGLFARTIVFILAIMSLASLIVMFERIFFFRRSRIDSVRFASKMSKLLESGNLGTALSSEQSKNVGYLGRVINAGLTALRLAPKARDAAIESVARSLERQVAREVQNFKRGLGILATVGSTAPFVGLLGTVMGIVNSFQSMAMSGAGGLGTVSAGIAEALITTAFGLIVAIPAVMAYNFLQGWIDARTVDMSESSNEFLDFISKQLAP